METMTAPQTKETKKKVLIVEDDPFISDIYQVKVHYEGLEALAAMNGAEALSLLESGTIPDLILLDIIMPVMDGMEFLRHIKTVEKFKDIPVILLTNLSDKSQIEECLQLGARDYIVKSHFTPSEVMTKIYAVLKT
jgi:CheY-like chemotaxis protein